MSILVTGGSGFIGSHFIIDWLAQSREPVVNLDILTYAAAPGRLDTVLDNPRYVFVAGDICDAALVTGLLRKHEVRAVVHIAAESHVDRSIASPGQFVRTNLVGTFQLLEAARSYWCERPEHERRKFRFLHVSTDEVYGSLEPDDASVTERSQIRPSSPYAASKAGSDHLVHAYQRTYALPTLTTNCSNNYGPFQLPEKLIPLAVLNALDGRTIPVYGDGLNTRDWLCVGDHCNALRRVLERGAEGARYNIGGRAERANIDVVRFICRTLDEIRPRPDGATHDSLIQFVQDRPGHDRRYSIDCTRIERELGWAPSVRFEDGLRSTVEWCVTNEDWLRTAREHASRHATLGGETT